MVKELSDPKFCLEKATRFAVYKSFFPRNQSFNNAMGDLTARKTLQNWERKSVFN